MTEIVLLGFQNCNMIPNKRLSENRFIQEILNHKQKEN